MLTLLMSFASVGDRRLLGYDKPPKTSIINSKLIVMFAPVCIVSQMMYLYANYKDLNFDTLGIIFSIFPASCLANVNIMSARLKSYKRLIVKLFTEIHLYAVFKENKTQFVKNRLLATERYTRWTTYYLVLIFLCTWFGWIFLPAANNYKKRELIRNHTTRLQTCIFLYLPIDYSYNFYYWYVIHTINFHVVGCGVMAMAAFQSLNNIFIFNLIGHILILKNTMKTTFEEDLTDEEVKERLVKIIKYHSFIMHVFKELEFVFGFNVIANYAQNLFGISIVLYQLMYGDKESMILYIMMIMAYTGGPILMSFVLEEIKKQTDDLPEVAYSMPWEKMSISNQKIVILILQRMQIVFEFEALGMLVAGVKPMFSILKTTFSYYVMLERSMTMKS